MRKLATSLFLLGIACGSNVQAITVFSTDFESGRPSAITGAGAVIGTEGYSAHGFGRNYFHNATLGNPAAATTLSLAGLPAHSSLSITFSLAIIDSWDGDTASGGSAPPDFFNVLVDGSSVFSETFDNFILADGSYSASAPITFGSNLAQNASWDVDSAWAITLSVPHSASALTTDFFASGGGWQGGLDESWAIDNISVDAVTAAVPDAGTTSVLLGLGLLGLAGAKRKLK